MEEIRQEEDERYRGRDLMNIQKKIIFETLNKEIKEQKGKFAYFLDKKNEYTQEYIKYNKQLMGEKNAQGEQKTIERLEEKTIMILQNTENILKILQPLYTDLFDQVAKKIPPGTSYNLELKQDVRMDLIFGEKDIMGNTDGSRDVYWMESLYTANKEQKIKQKEKKEKKVRLPAGHRLITDKNYSIITQEIIGTIETTISNYGKKFAIDLDNPLRYKEWIQSHFLYILINVLISKKLVFDMKSTKSTLCLDETILALIKYFHTNSGSDIKFSSIKKKLRHHTREVDGSLDLAYEYADLDDIESWQEYINETFFCPQGVSIEELRRDIMEEYNSQKGLKETLFEFLNPLYHIYKDKQEKHQKHLAILKDYQKKTGNTDPHIQKIIHEIEESYKLARTKKVEHTKLEEKYDHIKPIYDHSLTEIQNKTLKRYKVPIQYRHIFGIVLNKINNFHQIKANLLKKAEKKNRELTEQLLSSQKSFQEIIYYLKEYRTQEDIDKASSKKWEEKREERKVLIKYISANYKHFMLQKTNKTCKKDQEKKENYSSNDLFTDISTNKDNS